MENNAEISALVKLLDDPDEEVYHHVEQKLLEYGGEVINFLENAWEQSFDGLLQERIENIVHQIQFKTVKEDLNLWHLSGAFDLLHGALIINRYQYPDLDEQKIIIQLEDIKREIWLGLQYEMSSVEKVKLINHVLYQQFGFAPLEEPDNSLAIVIKDAYKKQND